MASRTDDYHKLDLTDFDPNAFDRFQSGSVCWSRGEHLTGSIRYRLHPDFIELNYSPGDKTSRREICDRIHFAFTKQPFGGHRRWFSCPSCNLRCRVLFGGVYFRCRRCPGATYQTQYDRTHFPNLAKAEKARERVGGEPGLLNPFPSKPVHMHWRTYRSLQSLNLRALERAEQVISELTL